MVIDIADAKASAIYLLVAQICVHPVQPVQPSLNPDENIIVLTHFLHQMKLDGYTPKLYLYFYAQ